MGTAGWDSQAFERYPDKVSGPFVEIKSQNLLLSPVHLLLCILCCSQTEHRRFTLKRQVKKVISSFSG